MPEYTYTCRDCRKRQDIRHRAGAAPPACRCGGLLQREYTVPRINWGGLRPSQGDISDPMKRHFTNAQEARERHLEGKEAHEKRQRAAEAAEAASS